MPQPCYKSSSATTTITVRTAAWGRLLLHGHSPTLRRPRSPRSNDMTVSAASSTNISRSHDVCRVSGTHRTAIDVAAAVALGAILGRTAIAKDRSVAVGAAALLAILVANHLLALSRFHPRVARLVDHR